MMQMVGGEMDHKHILIVDDDRDFAESLEDYLLPFGYRIKTVYDLDGARMAMLESAPQVVLLDVRVGNHKGTDLIPKVRSEHPDAIFVVMTAFADTDTAIEALQKGADDYLRKPLNLDVLNSTLERCFKNFQLRREKEEAEQSLRASEARFRRLIEGSLLGIVIHREFCPLFANQALADLFGYANPEQLKSVDSLERFFAQRDRKKIREVNQAALNGGGDSSYRCELTGLYKHETPLQLECLAQSIQWEGEPATQFTLVDISDRVALETQVRHAQKMEAVGQLAGGIAHDINNMLQIITGYSEIARKKAKGSEELVSSLEKVLHASHGATNLTRQLLAFSRREVMRPQPLDLATVIPDLMQMIRRLIGEHIAIELQASDGPVLVEADKGMLEQMLVNLCVNARDAMEHGGTLTLRTDTVVADADFLRRNGWGEREASYVEIEVRDTGRGIPEDIIGQIFDPFFTTKSPGKGTGLGLSTAYGIVNQHEGLITVNSDPEKGTSFHIYLPSLVGGVPLQPAEAVPQELGGAETILLAEDAEPVLQLGVELLQDQGYRVISATNGEEAVAKFREEGGNIDLVMLDVVMPVMSGRDAFLEIRKINRDVPVLFCTGYSGQQFDEDFAREHAYQLIRKPYSPMELFAKVRESIGKDDNDRAANVSASR